MNLAGHVDLVTFDFDGTLCDSAEVKTEAFYRLYLEEEGEEFATAVRRHHLTHAGVSRYEKIRHYEEVMLGRPCDDARLAEMADRFAASVVEQVIAAPMLPGAMDFLERYGRQVPLTVASATPGDELAHIVAARGLDDYFAAVAGSPATKAEILAGYVDRFGAAAARTVMVGDQPSDHEAALAVGTRFVGVRPPGAGRLFPVGVPVIPDLRTLPEAIRQAAASRPA